MFAGHLLAWLALESEPMPTNHGTRTCYNTGCRCDPCVQASRDYDKKRRQKMLASKHGGGASVTTLPTSANADHEPGMTESAVLAEIAGLSSADSRPGLVAVAITLARVCDSPLAIAQHPSAGHRLSETLDKLRKGTDGKTGRLAAVRSMTRKPSKPGEAAG